MLSNHLLYQCGGMCALSLFQRYRLLKILGQGLPHLPAEVQDRTMCDIMLNMPLPERVVGL